METYCPSCQTTIDLATSDVCPGCGWKFNPAGASLTTIVKPAARPKIPVEVDLAATVDRTGSSEQFQAGIPMTYEIIVKQLAAKARSVRCWLQSHGDLDDGQDHVLHTDDGTPDQAVADIKTIKYGGGGDPPESHLDAIEHLTNMMPWTADPTRSRGAILAFLTADAKPTKSGISARELGEAIRRQGILFYLVCEPTPTLQELVNAAGGLMFEITNNPDPGDLQKIAGQLAASIVATVQGGDTVPMIAPTS